MKTGQRAGKIKYQNGVALLIFVIVIALAFISYIVSELSAPEVRYEQDIKTAIALKKAKQALLAYAMNYTQTGGANTQGPGNLPCPAELNGVQKAVGAIGAGEACSANPNGVIGRLPWSTLEIAELKDGSGENLWYAVSSSFVAQANRAINTSTTGRITTKNIDGTVDVDGTGNDAIIAVIIAPGAILERDDGVEQRRSSQAERLDAINYLDIAFSGAALEEDNANFINADPGGNGFIHGPIYNDVGELIVNDQIEVITYGDLMELVKKRVASDLAIFLNTYRALCGAYPEATVFDPIRADNSYVSEGVNGGHFPVDSPQWIAGGCADGELPEWVEAEEWHKESYYERAASLPCLNGIDCIIVNNSTPPVNNADAVIVFSGREQVGQSRGQAASDLADYFEGKNDDSDLVGDPLGIIYDEAEAEDYVYVIAP